MGSFVHLVAASPGPRVIGVNMDVAALVLNWFQSWRGRLLVSGVHSLYAHFGIQADLGQQLAAPYGMFKIDENDDPSVARLKWGIWVTVASHVLDLDVADAFVQLVIAVNQLTTPDVVRAWFQANRRTRVGSFQQRFYVIGRLMENLEDDTFVQQEELKEEEIEGLKEQVGRLPVCQTDLAFDVLGIFDLTPQVCGLFYTWMCMREHGGQLMQTVEEMIVHSKDVQGAALVAEAARTGVSGNQFLDLALLFLLNATTVTLMISSDLPRLYSQLLPVPELRFESIVEGRSVNLIYAVHKMFNDVKNQEKCLRNLPKPLRNLSEGFDIFSPIPGEKHGDSVLYDLHQRCRNSRVYQLVDGTAEISRLLETWRETLRGKTLMRQLASAYHENGWEACRETFPEEVAFWLYDCPTDPSIRRRRSVWRHAASDVLGCQFGDKFVELVEAVCRQPRVSLNLTLTELQEIRGKALMDMYQIIKPPGVVDHLRGKLYSEVVLYVIAKLCSLHVDDLIDEEDDEEDECNDKRMLEYSMLLNVHKEIDMPAEIRMVGSLERPSVFVVRDITAEVCREFYAWLHLPDKWELILRSDVPHEQAASFDYVAERLQHADTVRTMAGLLDVSEAAAWRLAEVFVFHGCELPACKSMDLSQGGEIVAGDVSLNTVVLKLMDDRKGTPLKDIVMETAVLVC